MAAGGAAGALTAFEAFGSRAAAGRVGAVGERVAEQVAALAQALSAAAGCADRLACGPALAACAELLARRGGDLGHELAATADGMTLALDRLVAADDEGADRVAGAAG